jgi:hypothetical protein
VDEADGDYSVRAIGEREIVADGRENNDAIRKTRTNAVSFQFLASTDPPLRGPRKFRRARRG